MADVAEFVNTLAASMPRDCIVETTADEVDDMLESSDGTLMEDVENAIKQAQQLVTDGASESYVLIRIKPDDAPETADAAS